MIPRIVSILTLLALILAPAGLSLKAQEADLQVEDGTVAVVLEASISSPANSYSAVVGQSIAFAAAVIGGAAPYTYVWDFGDSTNGLGKNVSKTYDTVGTFTVSLEVGDINRDTDTDSISVAITDGDDGNNPSVLIATISAPIGSTFNVGQAIDFSSAVTGGAAPYTYVWHFGDSTDGLGKDVTKTYDIAGTYTVTLEVGDVDRHEDTDTITVTITDDDDGNGGGDTDLAISNIRITDITHNSAIVRWTTNRVASSRVIYDAASHSSIATSSAPNFGYVSSTGTSDVDTKVTEHAVSVTGLAPTTTYYFRVISQE